MFETLRNALKVKDIRRKLLFTLFILIITRLGSQLPIPGIDSARISEYLNSLLGDSFNLLNSFTGGSFESMSVFALNVTPYITSSIIIQLLTIAIPALEEMHRDGEDGRKKINTITRFVTLGLAILESAGLAIGFGRQGLLSDFSPLIVRRDDCLPDSRRRVRYVGWVSRLPIRESEMVSPLSFLSTSFPVCQAICTACIRSLCRENRLAAL